MDQTSVDDLQKPITGLTRITQRFKTGVTPDRMFKALILDSDNLIPKAAPQAVKSIETISGIGGPGSIKKVHLGEGI